MKQIIYYYILYTYILKYQIYNIFFNKNPIQRLEYYSKIWDHNPIPLENSPLLQPVTQNHKMDSRDNAIAPSHKRYQKMQHLIIISSGF